MISNAKKDLSFGLFFMESKSLMESLHEVKDKKARLFFFTIKQHSIHAVARKGVESKVKAKFIKVKSEVQRNKSLELFSNFIYCFCRFFTLYATGYTKQRILLCQIGKFHFLLSTVTN